MKKRGDDEAPCAGGGAVGEGEGAEVEPKAVEAKQKGGTGAKGPA